MKAKFLIHCSNIQKLIVCVFLVAVLFIYVNQMSIPNMCCWLKVIWFWHNRLLIIFNKIKEVKPQPIFSAYHSQGIFCLRVGGVKLFLIRSQFPLQRLASGIWVRASRCIEDWYLYITIENASETPLSDWKQYM